MPRETRKTARKVLLDVLYEMEDAKERLERGLRFIRARLIEMTEEDLPPLERQYRREHSPSGVYRRIILSERLGSPSRREGAAKEDPKAISKKNDS